MILFFCKRSILDIIKSYSKRNKLNIMNAQTFQIHEIITRIYNYGFCFHKWRSMMVPKCCQYGLKIQRFSKSGRKSGVTLSSRFFENYPSIITCRSEISEVMVCLKLVTFWIKLFLLSKRRLLRCDLLQFTMWFDTKTWP